MARERVWKLEFGDVFTHVYQYSIHMNGPKISEAIRFHFLDLEWKLCSCRIWNVNRNSL